MIEATFRFYDELNDFLPADQRGQPVALTFSEHQTVKHLFESLGVPHPEVASVQINGRAGDFASLLKDGDQVDVLPLSPEECEAQARDSSKGFLLDIHLGKLARYLRILGFDTIYQNDFKDEELAEISHNQERILLTRDRRLLMRNLVQRGYCIRALQPRQQVLEVVQRFKLSDRVIPFQRCPHCNTALEAVSKADVVERLEPLTKRYFNDFHICPHCGQIYWKGSHYERMLNFIDHEVKNKA
ncbi:MAG: Mut7-C RNAse domain-containing protein [Anaerolineales bacterium]|jgi:uncharacterized protein with PIN domain